MKFSILIFVFIVLFVTCSYGYNVGVGCSKMKPKKLGSTLLSAFDPGYITDQAFCLSATKILLTNRLISSSVNVDGILENTYQIDWLIRLCNECPQYNIFNITAVDTISLTDLVFSNAELAVVQSITLLPNNEIAKSFFNSSISCDNINQTITCDLFGCSSFLSSYSIVDCQCTPDRGCADFNLTLIFTVTGSSPDICPSFSGNITNCIFANGTLCSQYSNNPACVNCLSTIPSFAASSFQKKKLLFNDNILTSIFNQHKPSPIDSLSLFPDLFPVCAKSCASPCPISFVGAQDQFNFTANMLCSLTNDQCAASGCASQSCDSAVFSCAWSLRNSFFTNQPFNFTVTLPFTPLLLSPECIVDPADPTGTTVLCAITSNTHFPIGVQGSLCVNKTETCINTIISANVTNIETGACNSILISNTTSNLIIPSSSSDTTLTKTAIDFANGQPIDAIDCTDTTVASQLVYYRITVTAPVCGPLTISFNDVGQYNVDTSFGNSGFVISDPTLSCNFVTGASLNTFECHTSPGQLSPGQVISVVYRVNVSCSLCNTFDSAACLNNFASNNLTNIQASSSICPINLPNTLEFLTPIVCPCPVCDCVADLFPPITTSGFADGIYLRSDTIDQGFTTNYISCIVNATSTNYNTNYTSPIYGWFIHGGQGRWSSDPMNNGQTSNTGHMPLIAGLSYSIRCCAYQNTFNFNATGATNDPVSNSPITTGKPITFIAIDNNLANIRTTGTFTCTNESPSTSFPSHYPIFRKIVG